MARYATFKSDIFCVGSVDRALDCNETQIMDDFGYVHMAVSDMVSACTD